MPNQVPEACPIWGAEPTLRKQCKVCGEGEWVIEHGGHWNREVVGWDCPAPYSVLGKRMKPARAHGRRGRRRGRRPAGRAATQGPSSNDTRNGEDGSGRDGARIVADGGAEGGG